eukprot:768139-Hanusia_phi.AAC.1
MDVQMKATTPSESTSEILPLIPQNILCPLLHAGLLVIPMGQLHHYARLMLWQVTVARSQAHRTRGVRWQGNHLFSVWERSCSSSRPSSSL